MRPELAFSRREYDGRVRNLRLMMKDERLDAIVTFNPSSHCYITGYQTLELTHRRCLVVPAEGDLVHVTSDFEEPGVHLSSTVKKTATYSFMEDRFAHVARRVLAEMGPGKVARVGVEMDSGWVLPPSRSVTLSKELGGMRLVDCTGLLRQLKLVKSPAEIDCFRQSCRITSSGMATAVDTAAAGKTDNEVAAEATRAMILAGSEYMCIPPIVTTGRRSGVPHSTHRRVRIRAGDVVFLELGACLNRYSGPLMRTVVIGGAPSAEVRRNSEILVEVLNEVVDLIRPGESCASISRKVRRRRPIGTDIISPALIEHDYGYNLDIGFPPNWSEGGPLISPKDETMLEPGMVFHLNETLRHVYRYGLCFSETVAVTKGGCEVLTDFERRLIAK